MREQYARNMELTWIKTHAPTWDEAGWRKCGLLNFREVVNGILVQCYLSKWDQGVVLLRDSLCGIEDIRLVHLRVERINDLCIDSPGWVVRFLDGGVQVPCCVIRVLATKFD